MWPSLHCKWVCSFQALLRPGRLDRIVYVPLPDSETRKQIFSLQLKKMPVCPTLDVNTLVDKTEGYSGAEVTQLEIKNCCKMPFNVYLHISSCV